MKATAPFPAPVQNTPALRAIVAYIHSRDGTTFTAVAIRDACPQVSPSTITERLRRLVREQWIRIVDRTCYGLTTYEQTDIGRTGAERLASGQVPEQPRRCSRCKTPLAGDNLLLGRKPCRRCVEERLNQPDAPAGRRANLPRPAPRHHHQSTTTRSIRPSASPNTTRQCSGYS